MSDATHRIPSPSTLAGSPGWTTAPLIGTYPARRRRSPTLASLTVLSGSEASCADERRPYQVLFTNGNGGSWVREFGSGARAWQLGDHNGPRPNTTHWSN